MNTYTNTTNTYNNYTWCASVHLRSDVDGMGLGLPSAGVVADCPYCGREIENDGRFSELGVIGVCPCCGRSIRILPPGES